MSNFEYRGQSILRIQKLQNLIFLLSFLQLWFFVIVDIALDVNNKKPTVQKSLSDMTASIDISSHADIVECPHKISSFFNFRISRIFFRNYFIIFSKAEWIMCISVIKFFSWIRAFIPFTHSFRSFVLFCIKHKTFVACCKFMNSAFILK